MASLMVKAGSSKRPKLKMRPSLQSKNQRNHPTDHAIIDEVSGNTLVLIILWRGLLLFTHGHAPQGLVLSFHLSILQRQRPLNDLPR